jgi:putative multiple sugar transport system substrate-binding protein
MKKSILFILVATLIISMIAGCGTQPAEPANPSQPSESKGSKSGEGKTIGISLTSKALARTNLDSIYLSEYLKELGYEVIIQFSEGDVNVQNSQIETMVGLGIDGLIVSPSDGTGLTNAMEICHENDVKVCVYDALVMNSPYVEYYATDDLFAVGKCQGQYIVDKLDLASGAGPFNIELFAGSMTDNNATFFFDGAMSVLQPYIDKGQLVVQSGQTTFAECSTERWNAANAQNRADTILSTYYTDKNIDACLTQNDDLATGVISALKSVGYGTADKPLPITTGQDCNVSAIKSIIAGEQTSTVFKDIKELAKAATNIIDAMVNGREVVIPEENLGSYNNNVVDVPTYQVKPKVLDKSNWYELIIESGFYTPEDLGMTAEEAKAKANS